MKPPAVGILASYYFVLEPFCLKLKEIPSNFPVSLVYSPHVANVRGQALCGKPFVSKDVVNIKNSVFSSIYYNISEDIKQITFENGKPKNKTSVLLIHYKYGF